MADFNMSNCLFMFVCGGGGWFWGWGTKQLRGLGCAVPDNRLVIIYNGASGCRESISLIVSMFALMYALLLKLGGVLGLSGTYCGIVNGTDLVRV